MSLWLKGRDPIRRQYKIDTLCYVLLHTDESDYSSNTSTENILQAI